MPSNNLYITFIVMSIKFYLCFKKRKKKEKIKKKKEENCYITPLLMAIFSNILQSRMKQRSNSLWAQYIYLQHLSFIHGPSSYILFGEFYGDVIWRIEERILIHV